MAYCEELLVRTCEKCGTVNHMIVIYSGDGRANECEHANCIKCRGEIVSEKCGYMIVGATAEQALDDLRKVQNR